jgi:hypothetical protein
MTRWFLKASLYSIYIYTFEQSIISCTNKILCEDIYFQSPKYLKLSRQIFLEASENDVNINNDHFTDKNLKVSTLVQLTAHLTLFLRCRV